METTKNIPEMKVVLIRPEISTKLLLGLFLATLEWNFIQVSSSIPLDRTHTTSNLKFYSLYNRPSHWQLFVNFTRADGAAVELYEIYKSIVCPYLSNGEIDHWCNITQITEEFRYIYHHFTVDWRVGWWRLVKWTSFYFPFLHSTEILR